MSEKGKKALLWALTAVLVAAAVLIILMLQCDRAPADGDGAMEFKRSGGQLADTIEKEKETGPVVKKHAVRKKGPVKRFIARVKSDVFRIKEKPEEAKTPVEKPAKKDRKRSDFDDHPVSNVPSF